MRTDVASSAVFKCKRHFLTMEFKEPSDRNTPGKTGGTLSIRIIFLLFEKLFIAYKEHHARNKSSGKNSYNL
jgi:hypothetical protein